MSGNDWTDLLPGQRFRHGHFLKIEVKQLGDGVYPFIQTGPATMTLPWRYREDGGIQVCLLAQHRADTGGGPILKVSGGYNGERDRETAALIHTRDKLGLVPESHGIVWWRACLGVGPQYNFPIDYSFLLDPTEVGDPQVVGCERRWMPLADACERATTKTTSFFDDFSSAHLLTLMMHHERIAAEG